MRLYKIRSDLKICAYKIESMLNPHAIKMRVTAETSLFESGVNPKSGNRE